MAGASYERPGPCRPRTMPSNLRAEICVAAAIFQGQRLLLVRRSFEERLFPGAWEIPGGHVEQGETLEAALHREVKEETGLAICVGPPFFAWQFGDRRLTVEVDFLATLASPPKVTLDPEEHVSFAWAKGSDLSNYPTDEAIARVLRAAFLSGVLRRPHSPARPPLFPHRRRGTPRGRTPLTPLRRPSRTGGPRRPRGGSLR